MLAIVRVTRHQLNDLYFKLQPQNRNIFRELTIGHVYVSPGNVLYVCDQDTELFQYPAGKDLSVAETIREMVTARVKKDGYEQVTGG
jgi:hypothetical protein